MADATSTAEKNLAVPAKKQINGFSHLFWERVYPVVQEFCVIFSPNANLSRRSMGALGALWIVAFFLFWMSLSTVVIPKPQEVYRAFFEMWAQGLGVEIFKSFNLNLHALALTTIISLTSSYLTVFPIARHPVGVMTKGRFLGLAGISYIFTVYFGGGYNLKVALLTLGETVFFVTYMNSVIASIPREEYDYARTIGMSEIRVVWHVVIRGRMDEAIEAMRQNAAIGWMMLTMVEGIMRSGGGVGAMILNEEKHFQLAAIIAIQITIVCVGVGFDFALGQFKRLVCPFAFLSLERK